MKALFVHSSRFIQLPNGEIYHKGQFPYRLWWRYLRHFDELQVVVRVAVVEHVPNGWELSSGPYVSFAGVPDDHGNYVQQLRRGSSLRILQREIAACDAVIVRVSMLGWLAAAQAERQKKPWAVEVVGDAWDAYWNYGSLAGKLYAPIAYWQARRWIGRAPFAIYVTREYLQKRYPCNGIHTWASNVEIPAVDKSVLTLRLEKSKRLKDDPNRSIKCGLIGNLSASYKGLHTAMRALKRLRDRGITVHLYNLGHGKVGVYQKESERMGVADLLHLEGILPSGDPVFQWLDNLDLYIQPSFTEGLPRALVEAMSRGLPCLASTCGGIPELLPAECLHRPGDDKKLAADIERMIRDETWRVDQCVTNFANAKQYYAEQLDARRDNFWRSFAEHVRQSKKY